MKNSIFKHTTMKKINRLLTLMLLLGCFSVKAQWTRINNSPTQAECIYFYNAQIGYALKNNEIHKTIDGGTTWNNTPTNFNLWENINNIFFVNQDTGFVSVRDGSTFAYPVSVYITQDGGITWNSLLGPFDGGILDFHFQNSTNWYFHMSSNWFTGPADTIYQTADAGSTWTKTGNATQVQYNQLINNLIVYKDSVTPNQDNLFYKSTDGGATWNLLLTDNTASAAFMDYQFLNSSDGYVLLYQYDATDNIDSKIYKTTDGGLTWNNYTLPTVCSNPQNMHFTSINTGYIVSNNTVQSRSEIFKTTDAGQTWSIDFSGNAGEYFAEIMLMYSSIGRTGIWEYYGNLYVLGNDVITISTTTSVNETDVTEKVTIFPNPFSTQATLTLSNERKNASLKVYDLQGKEVKNINFSGKQITVERENLESGMYFYQIISEEKIISQGKIIIH